MSKTEIMIGKDSEEMRMLAGEVIRFHLRTRDSASMMAAHALACGYRLLKANHTLPHGSFLKWMNKYLAATIGRATAYKYMAMAEKVLSLAEVKFPADGNLPPGKRDTVEALLAADEKAFTEAHVKRLLLKVKDLVEGKSLQQLYLDFGIVKPRETKALKYERRLGPPTGDRAKDDRRKAKLWVENVVKALDGANVFCDCIGDDDLNTLKQALEKCQQVMGFIPVSS